MVLYGNCAFVMQEKCFNSILLNIKNACVAEVTNISSATHRYVLTSVFTA